MQLKERRQRATESLTELGQDIWRLTNLAYQTAPADLRETLAKEHFIDALVSSDMRLRIKQARPTSLNMAVRHAVELEAFNKAEEKHLEGEGYMSQTNQEIPRQKLEESDELKSLKETMKSMQKTLESLSSKGDLKNKTENRQPQFNRQSYNSQQKQFQQNRSRKC